MGRYETCAGMVVTARIYLILYGDEFEVEMPRRRIGQEALHFPDSGHGRSFLDQLSGLIDWAPLEAILDDIYGAPKGEVACPPLALFKAMLLAVWYDLSDVKLSEALDDRASFRRFCGFSHRRRRRNGRRSYVACLGIFEPVELRQAGLERRHYYAEEADERGADCCAVAAD